MEKSLPWEYVFRLIQKAKQFNTQAVDLILIDSYSINNLRRRLLSSPGEIQKIVKSRPVSSPCVIQMNNLRGDMLSSPCVTQNKNLRIRLLSSPLRDTDGQTRNHAGVLTLRDTDKQSKKQAVVLTLRDTDNQSKDQGVVLTWHETDKLADCRLQTNSKAGLLDRGTLMNWGDDLQVR